VKRWSKLHPSNFPTFCLLSRDDIGQEVGSQQEPTIIEDVENVKHQEINILRSDPLCLASNLQCTNPGEGRSGRSRGHRGIPVPLRGGKKFSKGSQKGGVPERRWWW